MGEEIIIQSIKIIQNGLVQVDFWFTQQEKGERAFCDPDRFFNMIGESMQENHNDFIKKNGGNMENENHLTLKWGTLKSWNFEGIEEAIPLFKRYGEIGSSFGAAQQNDTPEQKEIICKLIDLVPGEIYLDWSGEYVSKEEAKKYVMEYGSNK
jgi:hypothetical protein